MYYYILSLLTVAVLLWRIRTLTRQRIRTGV